MIPVCRRDRRRRPRSVLRLDVDQRAVRISELKAAKRTLSQQCQPRRTFGIEVDGFGREADVGLCDLVEMSLEDIELGYAKTDVIHSWLFDAGAVEGGNLPQHDCHGDPTIGQLVTTVFGRNVAGFELEHVRVEIGDTFRVARAQREMTEGRFLLPLALGIDLGPVFVSGLRQVEVVARGVVRAVTRKRPVTRPLYDLDVGIFLGDLAADLVEILHFDAEVVEARLAPPAARDQRHAEIAVADRNRADLARGVARRLQAEDRPVEHAEQRVVVARYSKVIELSEHCPLRAIPWPY